MTTGWAGGDRLKAYLEKASNALETASEVRVGFLENATEADGTSVAMIAAIQEFGAPKAGIPPRPFFRTMIAAHKNGWPKEVGEILKDNGYNTARTLNLMGKSIGAELRQSIVDTNDPPLSPVTLMLRKMRKGNRDMPITGAMVAEARRRVAAGESTSGESDKPLVYSGTLLNSVDYEVE